MQEKNQEKKNGQDSVEDIITNDTSYVGVSEKSKFLVVTGKTLHCKKTNKQKDRLAE